MQKKWELNEKCDEDKVRKLSEQLNNLDTTLTQILLQRGIDTFEKAEAYFRPNLKKIHDPFLMKDMHVAVHRLQEAMNNKENILVYGDYDVDGTTSVALVYSYLKHFYPSVKESEYGLSYYIPDRYSEGYGISFQGIDYAFENNVKLIIALDCGIKAMDKVAYAKTKGIDFIICDHHQPGEELPEAIAVLDPKRKDCEYPYKELSGCGVGFKLMQAWTKSVQKEKGKLMEFLDLLAISICADIVPITGENRIFVHHGLKCMKEKPRVGIETMILQADLKKELSVRDLVFTIAPRINAAGRIETGNKAVEILVAEDVGNASQAGLKINQLNTDRKELDRSITKEALAIIEEDKVLQEKRTTVLYNENWHKGVIGIVASRLIETYYRPTVVLTKSNGKATGSVRSVKGFDVYKAISACGNLLEQYGGHKYAAGLTMSLDNIEPFAEKFEQVVSEQIPENLLIPQITVDAMLQLQQITPKFVRVLKQFEPFGPQNMTPIFRSNNLLTNEHARLVGENHLKMEVYQEEDPSIKFSCIGFGLGENLAALSRGKSFDMVYSVEENVWKGFSTMQLNVKDIKFRR